MPMIMYCPMFVAVDVNMPCKHPYFIPNGRMQSIAVRKRLSAKTMFMIVAMIVVMLPLFPKIEP